MYDSIHSVCNDFAAISGAAFNISGAMPEHPAAFPCASGLQ